MMSMGMPIRISADMAMAVVSLMMGCGVFFMVPYVPEQLSLFQYLYNLDHLPNMPQILFRV